MEVIREIFHQIFLVLFQCTFRCLKNDIKVTEALYMESLYHSVGRCKVLRHIQKAARTMRLINLQEFVSKID